MISQGPVSSRFLQSWRRILKWVESGEKEERRADLSRTYLYEVDLHDAHLESDLSFKRESFVRLRINSATIE